MLANIGILGELPHDLGDSARITILLASFVQHTDAQDLRRAMMLHINSATTPLTFALGTSSDLSRATFEVLLERGTTQKLEVSESSVISNDFAVTARLLSILDFTPARLLYPFTRWQTSEYGSSQAREELSQIVSADIVRSRYCMLHAAQLFQFFRTVNTLQHTDVVSFLVCTLYLHLCTELVIRRTMDAALEGTASNGPTIIRLDKVAHQSLINDWLSLRIDPSVHITGVGILNSDRSTARLYKESARVLGKSASKSNFAAALQKMMESQAAGDVPVFEEKQ